MASLDDFAPALNALNSGIANFASAAQTEKQLRKAYQYQKDFYYRQVEQNRQDWLRQNDYNSDVSRANRARAAGLNPVSSDGLSNASTINAASASPQNMGPIPDFQAPINASLQTMATRANIDLAQSQAELNYSKASSERGETPVSLSTMSVNDSVVALNRATQNLTRIKGIGESTLNRIKGVDEDIRVLDRNLRQLDYQRESSSFSVETPSGARVDLPTYLADVILKGAEIESAWYARDSNKYNSRKLRVEADNWEDQFRLSLESIRADIRAKSASTEFQEFTNKLNRRLENLIYQRMTNENFYESRRYGNLYWEEKKGVSPLGRIIHSISPFSSVVK
ncbi:MAG: DNA pilot protein [Microviridae sp.]|nr:MAG: DNA pilot protein [Microviridae sp.]